MLASIRYQVGGGVVGRPRWYLGSRNTAAPVSYVRVRRFIVPPWSILVAGGLNLGRSKRRVGLEALGAVSKLATVKHKFVKRNPSGVPIAHTALQCPLQAIRLSS